MAPAMTRRVRPLYAWEIAEARSVFGDQLAYERVRVHEGVSWPDTLDRLGRWLKRTAPPRADEHNAITLGYHCFFPVPMPRIGFPPGDPQDLPNPEDSAVSWLIHELTHVWQFQRLGWRVLWRALMAQLREGEAVYDYGGPEGLFGRSAAGWTLHDFNLEQQGAIAASYYLRQRMRQDVRAWLPYIANIQGFGIEGKR